MTELQNKLLDILVWFDAVCQENKLNYYLVGGTMLGAMRHQGFIPWDDDIDVGMPREDYKKLASILSTKKDGKYVLETPETDAKEYYYPCSKIYDTTTTLIENTKAKIKRGIYIDVFPLDGIGDSQEEGKENYKKIHRLHYFLLSRVTGIRKGRSFFKNAAVIMMKIIPEFLINNKRILKMLTTACQQRSFEKSSFVGNLVGAWQAKEIMPKVVFGTPTKVLFENVEVFGVECPDEYLTYLYGDWRKLPPPEKQVSHHDFILLDLNKPYMSN